ncbi:MAG: hypothetical protein OXI60_07745 [Acidiferrobacterales bacterium]|nr:hypothetical protein [Acidiferrobacterales bacterium]
MNISDELIDSIYEAVESVDQPETVAKRLVAWLNEMSYRELSAEEEREYLENLKSAISDSMSS